MGARDRSSKGFTIVSALLLLARLGLAAVFLYAAYAKLRPQAAMAWSVSSVRLSLSLFSLQVDSYRLLPTWAVSPIAHALPLFELALGLLLLIGWQLRFTAALVSALLLAFFAVMVRTYALGLEINCGCFGPGETLGVKTLVRDGSLLAISLALTAGAFFGRREKPAMAPPAPAFPQKAE